MKHQFTTITTKDSRERFSPFEKDPKWYGQTKQSKGGVVVLSYSDEYGKGGYNMVDGGAFKEIWGDRDPSFP